MKISRKRCPTGGGRHGVLVRLASLTLLMLAASAGSANAADDAVSAASPAASGATTSMRNHAVPSGSLVRDDGKVVSSFAAAPAASGAITSMRNYAVPAVNLVRDDGKVVSLPDEMNDGRPIVLNFIFTTCSSICPLMSSVLAQFARRLGPDTDKVHLMSISIDPEHDTPARLREYARKFNAGLEWKHYTGTLDASIAAQRAFDVYRGSKMSHNAVTLIRAAPDKPWLRIEGFVKADDLVRDYRDLLAAR